MSRQKKIWILDAAMAGGFLLTFFLDVTGLEAHQWLGIGVGVIAAIHLLTHRTWVESVTRQFFTKASDRARLLYVLDGSILMGLALIIGTGLVVSSWLSLPLASYDLWKALHIVVSATTLMLAAFKIALHWRWIANVARREVFAPAAPRPALQPAPVVVDSGRRDFLKLMGVVGVASALAMGGALSGLTEAMADDSSAASAQAATSSRTSSATSSQSESGTCRVRCGKRCSYPGHCRKYADSNGNGRCDLGECL